MASSSSCSLVLVVLVALALAAVQAQKESRFKTCKRKQPLPQLNECVRSAIDSAIPYIAKGLPEYGISPIDPLRVVKMEIPKGKGAVSVDLTFNNLDILGLKNVKVKSVDINVEKMFLKGRLEVQGNVMLLGDYVIDGKVLVLPIQGKGRCNITLVNPKIDITELQAKPVTKNGKQHASVTSFKLVVASVDRVYYKLNNLFNGNKQLGDNMNAVLNDNWKEVYDDMVGPVQGTLALAIRKVVESMVGKADYATIFPPK